jgi:hypothetical protein
MRVFVCHGCIISLVQCVGMDVWVRRIGNIKALTTCNNTVAWTNILEKRKPWHMMGVVSTETQFSSVDNPDSVRCYWRSQGSNRASVVSTVLSFRATDIASKLWEAFCHRALKRLDKLIVEKDCLWPAKWPSCHGGSHSMMTLSEKLFRSVVIADCCRVVVP